MVSETMLVWASASVWSLGLAWANVDQRWSNPSRNLKCKKSEAVDSATSLKSYTMTKNKKPLYLKQM